MLRNHGWCVIFILYVKINGCWKISYIYLHKWCFHGIWEIVEMAWNVRVKLSLGLIEINVFIYLVKLYWKERWKLWSQWKYCVEELKMDKMLHCINWYIGISINSIMKSFEIWFENFAFRKECWETSFPEMVLGVNTVVSLERWCRL